MHFCIFNIISVYTVNSEIIVIIYCCHFETSLQNVRLINVILRNLSANIVSRFKNASSYFCDYHPVTLFPIIKTSQ